MQRISGKDTIIDNTRPLVMTKVITMRVAMTTWMVMTTGIAMPTWMVIITSISMTT